jgi:[FeFe] hydrogenase H-cluster maturation GTPase HydF
MNNTPSANRVHIGFFGRRNVGKSRLVNAVTGQDLAVVSDVKGTTTDPVYKAMELLPLGPVLIIDTPGIDDEGGLGELRVGRARRVLNKIDVAVLVVEAGSPLCAIENELIDIYNVKSIPFIIAQNKCDLITPAENEVAADLQMVTMPVSAKTGENINVLKDKLAVIAGAGGITKRLVDGLVNPFDFVVLVVPIDKAAPKGRLILPQQQTIRDILEVGAIAIVVRDFELEGTLARLEKKPAMVITDSQAFAHVSAVTPQDVPLTSFSILFTWHKGWLETSILGLAAMSKLQDGDAVLICEGCTHHRQCDDIGTVKLPRIIKDYTGKEPVFSFCSGGEFPDDLSPYKMIIHCGACMLNDREMHYRYRLAEDQNIPFTNYGIVIAHANGILKRSIEVFV